MTNKYPPTEFTKAELLFFWLTIMPTTLVSTFVMLFAIYFVFTGGDPGGFAGIHVYFPVLGVINFCSSLTIQFPVVYALGKRRRLNAITATFAGGLAALPLIGLWWILITIVTSGVMLDDAFRMAVMLTTSALGGFIAYLLSWRYQPKPATP